VSEVEARARASLERLGARAETYVAAAKAANTLKAYRSDWREFESWARTVGLRALPATPDTVALYIADLAQMAKASTIARRLTSIAEAHRAARQPSPVADPAVVAVWDGIRRVHGSAVENAEPIRVPLLARMIAALPRVPAPEDPRSEPQLTLGSKRDKALLLVGFAGALRRSELAALDYEDLSWVDEGLVVTIRRSKTDQEGAGRRVGIPYGSKLETCPVRAADAWCQAARISEGRLFRPVNRGDHLSGRELSAAAINRIVQRAVARTGADPIPYSAHSLRAGLATAAAEAGVDERSIMAQTGHKSVTVARGYIREGSLFRNNPAAQVGL
jgi:integrase